MDLNCVNSRAEWYLNGLIKTILPLLFRPHRLHDILLYPLVLLVLLFVLLLGFHRLYHDEGVVHDGLDVRVRAVFPLEVDHAAEGIVGYLDLLITLLPKLLPQHLYHLPVSLHDLAHIQILGLLEPGSGDEDLGGLQDSFRKPLESDGLGTREGGGEVDQGEDVRRKVLNRRITRSLVR